MTKLFLMSAALFLAPLNGAAAPQEPMDQNVAMAAPPLPDTEALPAERLLSAVLDAAMGRVSINRARRVRIEDVHGGPEQIRFTLVNTAEEEQSIRIGILHLKAGGYDVYAAGPVGSGTRLDNHHLAAGWRFVLPAPQTATPFGRYVQRLAGAIRRTRLLLSTRAEPVLTKALTPLETAVRHARAELGKTRRTDVSIVPDGTRFIRPPVERFRLSEEEIRRMLGELSRLHRELLAAADSASDRAVANRVRLWFAFEPPKASSPARRERQQSFRRENAKGAKAQRPE